MPAAAAAYIDTEFVLPRSKAALQGADHAGGDAGRMPIHAHHGPERLEPERVREPLEKGVTPVMEPDGLGNDRAQRRHALTEPGGHAAAMERKISAAGAFGHQY